MRYPIRILHQGMTWNYGGVEAFVMNLYRNIDRDKFQFDFINDYFPTPIAFEDEIKSLGGRVFAFPRLPRSRRLEAVRGLKEFFYAHREIQILHNHDQYFHKNLFLKYASKAGLPVIYHLHNAVTPKPIRSVKDSILKFASDYWHNSYRKYVDVFFACSELVNEKNCNGRAIIFKNSIDVDRFRYCSEVRTQTREELGLGDSFAVISVGTLSYQKNPLFILDVFKSIKNKKDNAKLILVGDGDLRNEVLRKVDALGLNKDVVLLGIRHDVERLLQAADAFLFPSRYEGFGIVLVEAQASGLPCFTSRDVVPSEVNLTGLVRYLGLEESPETWADAVLSSDGRLRKDYGDVLKAKGYDGQSNVKIMEAKYLELVQGKTNKRS